MYVVLGASGNTGHIVAKNLLAHREKVRVVGRNEAHLQPLAAQGAETFIGEVTNADSLTQAFHNADAAYVMIPPNLTSNDFRGYQETVTDAIAAALKNAGVKNIVSLSSVGADKTDGTGPVLGLHNLEQKLNQLDGLNVLHLRAGYFMENTLPQAGVIRMTGSAIGPVAPALKLPMIATRDIGEAAADALLRLGFRGKQTRELQGHRDLDYTEAAAIIGKAIGKPALGYIQAPAVRFALQWCRWGCPTISPDKSSNWRTPSTEDTSAPSNPALPTTRRRRRSKPSLPMPLSRPISNKPQPNPRGADTAVRPTPVPSRAAHCIEAELDYTDPFFILKGERTCCVTLR